MFRQTHISHHTFGDCLMRYRNIVSRSDLNHWKNNWENRRWQIITGNITGGWYRWCLSGVLLVWYRDRVVPKRETRGDNQRPLGSELCWAWVFANSLFHGVVARLDPTALAEYWANYDTLQILITKNYPGVYVKWCNIHRARMCVFFLSWQRLWILRGTWIINYQAWFNTYINSHESVPISMNVFVSMYQSLLFFQYLSIACQYLPISMNICVSVYQFIFCHIYQ